MEATHIDTFDWAYYLQKYEDLGQVGINDQPQALQHWLDHGSYEGRCPRQCLEPFIQYFDWQYYISAYTDLTELGLDTPQRALDNWLNCGIPQQRRKYFTPDMSQTIITNQVKKYNLLTHLKIKYVGHMDYLKYPRESEWTANYLWALIESGAQVEFEPIDFSQQIILDVSQITSLKYQLVTELMHTKLVDPNLFLIHSEPENWTSLCQEIRSVNSKTRPQIYGIATSQINQIPTQWTQIINDPETSIDCLLVPSDWHQRVFANTITKPIRTLRQIMLGDHLKPIENYSSSDMIYQLTMIHDEMTHTPSVKTTASDVISEIKMEPLQPKKLRVLLLINHQTAARSLASIFRQMPNVDFYMPLNCNLGIYRAGTIKGEPIKQIRTLHDDYLDEFDFYRDFQDAKKLTNFISYMNSSYDLMITILSIFSAGIQSRLLNELTTQLYVYHWGSTIKLNKISSIYPPLQTAKQHQNLMVGFALNEMRDHIIDHIEFKHTVTPLPLDPLIAKYQNQWAPEPQKQGMAVISRLYGKQLNLYADINLFQPVREIIDRHNVSICFYGHHGYPDLYSQFPYPNHFDIELDQLFSHMRKYHYLIYTSREANIVQYSPLEAIFVGLPVFHFRESLLSKLIGQKTWFECDSVEEMGIKISQFNGNDMTPQMQADLIVQKKGIRSYTGDHVRHSWETMVTGFGTQKLKLPKLDPKTPLRIAYLFTHSALMYSEVKVMKALGHKVYVPAHPLEVEEDIQNIRNADLSPDDYAILDRLSISPGKVASEEVLEILNRNFDMVFLYWPNLPIIHQFSQKLNLHVLIRIFGLDRPSTYQTTYDAIAKYPKTKLIAAYKEILDSENPSTHHKYIYLPLPHNLSLADSHNQWIGSTQKILFVCSRINASGLDYYRNVYKWFKNHMGHLPYSVFGKQARLPVIDDGNVIPNASEAVYRDAFIKYKVMFYHGQEPSLLHYHPLEAIYIGQPVIFMQGSLLDTFSNCRSIARCQTIQEAVTKVTRILEGDLDFTQQVIADNQIILKYFSEKYYSYFFNQMCLAL